VYVIDAGKKRAIAGSGVFDQCGYLWANIDTLADSTVFYIASGSQVTGSPCPH
jgi:hypothetical protein